MALLYACLIEDLGPGDFAKVDCSVCDHIALLAPAFLFRLGLEPRHKVLDLKGRVRCRGCGVRGRANIGVKWAKSAAGNLEPSGCHPPLDSRPIR
jgi:hypothetical protein